MKVVEVQTLKAHTNDITCCDFSIDFLLATGSGDKTVRVWSWKTGLGYVETEFSPLKGHKYGLTCVSFSPQGTMLATCSIDGLTNVWNSKTGMKIHKFSQSNSDPVKTCRFNQDSCTMATGGDNGTVCIWDLVHRTLLRTIKDHEDTVNSVCYSSDSSFLMTSCNRGMLKLYSVTDLCDSTQENVNALFSIDDSHDLGVLSADFSTNIKIDDEDPVGNIYSLVTSGNEQCLKIWKIRAVLASKIGSCFAHVSDINVIKEAHGSAITCVRFSKKGDIFCSSSMDKCVKIWDEEGNCLQTLNGHSRYVNSVVFSNDSSMLCSVSNDKTIKIWTTRENFDLDCNLNKPCKVLSHFGCGDLEGITYMQENDLVFLKGNTEATEIQCLQTLDDVHQIAVNSLEFTPDGSLASGSGDKTVKLVKLGDDGKYFNTNSSIVGNHSYQVNTLTCPENGEIVSGSLDGNIICWNLDESKIKSVMTRNTSGVRCVRKCKNLILSSYDDGVFAVWRTDPPSTNPIVTYPEHAEVAIHCAYSPDGRIACSGSHNGDFRIYQLPDPDNPENCQIEPLATEDCAHDLGIQSVDFAPNVGDFLLLIPEGYDCHLLATCGNDGLVKVWKILITKPDAEEMKVEIAEWRVYSGHGSSVTNVRFPKTRPDIFASTSTNMQTRIWSTYYGKCLHVLEHESLVACCAFSPTASILATGCITGQIYIWKLPLHLMQENDLVFTIAPERNILEWGAEDVESWIKSTCFTSENPSPNSPDLGLPVKLKVKLYASGLNGQDIVTDEESVIWEKLGIDINGSAEDMNLIQEIKWLRKSYFEPLAQNKLGDPPHHFLCPITHSLMIDPVKCSDGFTYERKALHEWFLSGGKLVSPMTNQPLLNNIVSPNRELKKAIKKYLYGDL